MSDLPPDAPPVPVDSLTAIAEYAEEFAAWLGNEQIEAAKHGHAPGSQQSLIDGWTFVAEAMREWILSEP